MSQGFTDDLKDRKRRFLRGLNALLGLGYHDLENRDIPIREAKDISISNLRHGLAEIYCLEFTPEELIKIINSGTTTGEFTEKYVKIIYQDRGEVDMDVVLSNSMSNGAIDTREMDKAPKYGLNGSEWCDVAKGPCSCGAWH